MVCIESAPTVDVFLRIPHELSGGGWAWGEHPLFAGVIASDYCYSAREALALVRTYARALAPQIRPPQAHRFSVLLRGRVTGMLVASDEWAWYAGTFTPSGEPWETWRAAAKRYWEITGTLIDRQRFRARVSAPLPQLPDTQRPVLLHSALGSAA